VTTLLLSEFRTPQQAVSVRLAWGSTPHANVLRCLDPSLTHEYGQSAPSLVRSSGSVDWEGSLGYVAAG
jgi:hypothetical protein